MAKLRAAILAAGRGVRMGGAQHKALIPLRDHEPLMHYTLAGLAKAGVDDLLVVTGHRHDDVAGFVTARWSSGQVAFVRNARFASWGNFHSLRLAIDQSPGADLLVVNCDVVVPPDVFTRAIETDGELVLAVQARRGLDQEDMRVQLRGDHVVAIGKDLKMATSHGEFCGVSMLRDEALRLYADICTRLEWDATTGRYYENVYAEMLEHVEARPAPVRAGEYAEVDDPTDVEAAAAVVERHYAAWGGSAPAGPDES